MSAFQARVPPHRCPFCGVLNDGVSIMDKVALPKPGDASLCFYCLNVSTFVEGEHGLMTVRLPTVGESLVYAADAELQAMVLGLKRQRQ
jgi:hypothetical protein